jgi:hypothetical protein
MLTDFGDNRYLMLDVKALANRVPELFLRYVYW